MRKYIYNVDQKQIQNIYKHMIKIIRAHNILKAFWYLAVLIANKTSTLPKPQIWSKMSISFFKPILAAIFVYIATVKVQIIPDFYTCSFVLIK